MWGLLYIHQWIQITDVEKTKQSWNTLSHLNMIGLTHTRHTQVIVEVNAPFTSLCGYLTDINSGGVVRQPIYHSLFP